MSAVKYRAIPTQYTHIISLISDEETGEQQLWFDPILALQVSNIVLDDICYAYFVLPDGMTASPDGKVMLYDFVHGMVSYNFEAFKYSYDECLKRLGGAQ